MSAGMQPAASGCVLRGYQVQAVDGLRDAIRQGARSPVLQAGTGAGKTVMAAEVIRSSQGKGKRCVFLAHRRELVHQASRKLTEAGVPHGILMAGETPVGRFTQVASVQTLASWWNRRGIEPPEADLVVVDECFPAGTLVDGRPIESLACGDRVWSFNHATGKPRRSRVTHLFRSKPSALLTVHLDSGETVVCTPGHPFHTAGGYIPAIALAPGTLLTNLGGPHGDQPEDVRRVRHDVCASKLELEDGADLLAEVPGGAARSSAPQGVDAVRTVSLASAVRGKGAALPVAGSSEQGSGVLLDCVQRRVDAGSAHSDRRTVPGDVQPSTRVGADDRRQSDGAGRGPSAGVAASARHGSSAAGAGWQRPTDAGAAESPAGNSRRGLDAGVRGAGRHGPSSRVSDALQAGPRTPWPEDCDRGGRAESLFDCTAGTGSSEGRVSEAPRVDRVEVHEPGSDGRYGGRCPDGYVYNIEVEGDHNYFVSGVLVHNCHRAVAPTYRKLMAHYRDRGAIVLGLTATPVRGDGQGLGDVFDAMVCCPTLAELTDEGHLVPARFFAPTDPDLTGVKVRRGDYVEADLGAAMDKPQLVGDVVGHWLRFASDRKTVVFASTVRHSVHLAEQFRAAGVAAAHLDGSTEPERRDAMLAALSAGDIQVVCNCEVLVEGWDQPDVSCLVLARPTKSAVRFLQMVGRVLRSHPGKTDALVLDHGGCVHEHGFPVEFTDWVLEQGEVKHPNPTQRRRRQAEARPIVCQQCFHTYTGQPKCPECGHQHEVRGRDVSHIDGELGEVKRKGEAQAVKHSMAEKRRWHAELLGIAAERGYRSGWAAHKYRTKFGVWPPRGWSATATPGPEVRRWVKHQQIVFAKQREAA